MSAPGEARPERPGEELDRERLDGWLTDHLQPGAAAPGESPLEVLQFPHGFSNLTYLLRWRGRDLVLRRPPVGSKVATAHDMGREHRILTRLHPIYPRAPKPLAACADPEILGAPFYVMERVEGVILRGPRPPVEIGPSDAARLGAAFTAELAALHRLDVAAAGLAEVDGGPGYVERQVTGWARRWQAARIEPVPAMEAVAAALADRPPAEGPHALVHNDFKWDNLVLAPADPPRIRAVLDWEMATVGDPLLDLGTTLGYWVEAGDPEPLRLLAFGPTALPGMPSRREIADDWSRATGRPLGDLPAAYAFGLFKIAVIAQQIYQRYAAGLTRDPRFAALPAAVALLARQAREAVTSGRV